MRDEFEFRQKSKILLQLDALPRWTAVKSLKVDSVTQESLHPFTKELIRVLGDAYTLHIMQKKTSKNTSLWSIKWHIF